MDRSEGEKPKARRAGLFQARGGGKPRVAQPPRRDKEAPEPRRHKLHIPRFSRGGAKLTHFAAPLQNEPAWLGSLEAARAAKRAAHHY